MFFYILLSLFGVLAIHLLAYVGIVSFTRYSNKRYKRFIATLSLWDRWFFLSVQRLVKDGYSKCERRFIRYTIVAKLYQIINYFIHIVFVIEVFLLLLGSFITLPFRPESVLFVYCLVCLGCLLIFSFSITYTSKEALRQQRRRIK